MLRWAYATLPLIICMSTAAQAEPTVYKGTVGKHEIVVEFADDIARAKEPVAGRYFYPIQGVDIPLNAVSAGSGRAELDEEKPCNTKICIYGGGDEPTKAPVNARWTLASSSGGAELTGTWQPQKGQPLPITLHRVASRSFGKSYEQSTAVGKAHAKTPDGLASITYEVDDLSRPFSEISPYDFLKMQVKLQESEETQWGNVAFRYVTDPRTKFAFPRVTRLGSPVNASHRVNVYLERQHWNLTLNVLSCKARQFAGFGWTSTFPDEALDSGGLDTVYEIAYLSPAIMSWTETGSGDCGGAHPSYMAGAYTFDLKRAEVLDMSRIFRGWISNPYGGDPNEELSSSLLKKAEAHGTDLPDECELKDNIKNHLQISFKQGDRAVFSLVALPHAISGVCQGEFFDAPLSELRSLLTPEAVEYFPSLKTP